MNAEHDAGYERLPRAWGAPPLRGVLRAQPEDFIVEEVLGWAIAPMAPASMCC